MKARWLKIAHQCAGRTRLRTPVLRGDLDACSRLADALAALPGVIDVAIRPFTGSVLIGHDDRLDVAAILATAQRVLACPVLGPGELPALDPDVPNFSSVARKLVAAFREIDCDVRRRTEGTVDLGTLAAFGFAGAGALEVATTGELPMPPWFNLAWWAFQTFMTTEQQEIRAEAGSAKVPTDRSC